MGKIFNWFKDIGYYIFLGMIIIIIIGVINIPLASAWFNNTFNNSLTTEDLVFTGAGNITRYLSVPTGTLVINGLFNLTYNSNTLFNLFKDDFDGTQLNASIWRNDTALTQSYTGGYYNWTSSSASLGLAIYNVTNYTNHCIVSRQMGTGTSPVIGIASKKQFNNATPISYIWGMFRSSNTTIIELTNSTGATLDLVSSSLSWATGNWYVIQLCNLGNNISFYVYNDSTGALLNQISVINNTFGSGWGGLAINGNGKTISTDWFKINTNVSNITTNYSVLASNNNYTFYLGNQSIQSFISDDSSNITSNATTTTITALQNYINTYTSSCTAVGGNCLVPFVFNSLTSGVLRYGNLYFTNAGAFINSIIFTNTTSVGASESFIANISYDSDYYPSISGILTYNGTNYTATKYGSGNNVLFVKNLTIPDIVGSSQNNNLFWTIILTNSSGNNYVVSTNGTQTVNKIDFDNCSAYNIVAYNFSLYDEDNLSLLNGTNLNSVIEVNINLFSVSGVNLSSFSFNFTKKNPVAVCVKPNILNFSNFTADVQVRYDADNYVSEFYNEQKTLLYQQGLPRNVSLYDLLTTRSQEFKLTFKNSALLPLTDYLVLLQRKYISDGQYRTVEIGKTDSDGITIEHLVLSEVYYKLVLTKDGEVVYTYPDFQAFCDNISTGDCQVTKYVYEQAPSITRFRNLYGIQYTPILYNASTDTVWTDFTVIDGSTQTLVLTITDVFGNQLSTTSLSSSSGTLSLQLPANTLSGGANNQTYEVCLTYGNYDMACGKIVKGESPSDLYGSSRWVMIVGIVLTMVMMTLSNGVMMIIMMIIGLILSGGLGLINITEGLGIGGLPISITSAILLLIIFILKVRNREAGRDEI